jgi:hypothetical protein
MGGLKGGVYPPWSSVCMRVITASYAASPQYQPPPTYNPKFGPVATPTILLIEK